MNYRRWFGGITLGLFIGVCVGLIQSYLFEKPKYIASVTLNERVLFDEYWKVAPDALAKAELRRAVLSGETSSLNSEYNAILGDLLNGWFRLLDETLFRFPIDEALKSNEPGQGTQRYARLNRGFTDGLNQRSITFRAVGSSADNVERELHEWVAGVQTSSQAHAHAAVKSWLTRKSDSLQALSEGGEFDLSEDELAKVSRMAVDFRRSANDLPLISPFQEEVLDVVVSSPHRGLITRVSVWGLMGAALAVVLLGGLQLKRRP
jgi:hypothetical protein|tara:strand:- start:14438 stop:15226 length:789 start_codon:yes stop_codon:yes gene_type:complete